MIKDAELLNNIKSLEEICGYKFKNIELPLEALSHSSYANEISQKMNKRYNSNERLEFLGDSVLSIIISEHLFKNFSEMPEGNLSRMRASIVCESSLAQCGMKIGLNKLIMLGSGENSSGGRERPSIIADCLEAVIGAIYLDGGLSAARKFVMRALRDQINDIADNYENFDYKTTLQELTQKENSPAPVYNIIKIEGPDHNRKFTVKVTVISDKYGIGTGKTKKEAEQKAAKDFIDKEYNKE